MKKFLLCPLMLLCLLSCEKEKEQQEHQIPLEITLQDSKFKLPLGSTSTISFDVAGIGDAEVEAAVTLRNPAWNAGVSLDSSTGKGVISIVTPATVGVTTAKLTVSDKAGGRAVDATIALASTADNLPALAVSFAAASYAADAGGQPVALEFTVNNLNGAQIDTPTEADVTTTLDVVSVSYDAQTASGSISVSASAQVKDGNFPVQLRVKDNFLREASGSTVVAVTGLPEKPAACNCVIVKPGETLSFVSKYDAVVAVALAWQDAPNLITSLSIANGEISVTAANASGNALVLGKNSSGTILWSWHLWVTDFDPEATAVTIDGITFMDRNLGAVSATPGDLGAMGQYYQWGRKDPFPRATSRVMNSSAATCDLFDAQGERIETVNGTTYYKAYDNSGTVDMAKAIANPEYFFFRNSSSMAWWSGIDYTVPQDWWGGVSGLKTDYDPCPKGWKVPVVYQNNAGEKVNPFEFIKKDAAVVDKTNYGLLYTGAQGKTLWFPTAGERPRTTGLATRTGLEGSYWLGTFDSLKASSSNQQEKYKHMQFSASTGGKRIDGDEIRPVFASMGISVRCIKE